MNSSAQNRKHQMPSSAKGLAWRLIVRGQVASNGSFGDEGTVLQISYAEGILYTN